MEQYTTKAHKIAHALSRRLGVAINVRRMPLGKHCMAFEFVSGAYSATFGQSFLDGNLAVFATRIMEGIAGVSHGHKKGHASH